MIKLNLSDNSDKTSIKLNELDITDSVLEYSIERSSKEKNCAYLTLKMKVSLDNISVNNEKNNS